MDPAKSVFTRDRPGNRPLSQDEPWAAASLSWEWIKMQPRPPDLALSFPVTRASKVSAAGRDPWEILRARALPWPHHRGSDTGGGCAGWFCQPGARAWTRQPVTHMALQAWLRKVVIFKAKVALGALLNSFLLAVVSRVTQSNIFKSLE